MVMCKFETDLAHYEQCEHAKVLREVTRMLRHMARHNRDMLILTGQLDDESVVNDIEEVHLFALWFGRPTEKAKAHLERRRNPKVIKTVKWR